MSEQTSSPGPTSSATAPTSAAGAGPVHLAVALDGFGWHPAAWRRGGEDPTAVFRPAYWTALARRAEAALLDFVTIEDGVGVQSSHLLELDERTDQVRGRLDAVLLANHLAPATHRLGIVPTATVTHSEPFHVSTSIATLDYVSRGRAGWRPQVSLRPADAALFGRRRILPALPDGPGGRVDTRALESLFTEAGDVVEVVRRLWDSWEDDAVIRDTATGRFVDVDRLHPIDFTGELFAVKGPSITPRPPQGQVPVVALAHSRIPFEFAARSADVVLITPTDAVDASRILAEVRAAQAGARAADADAGRPLLVLADVLVLLEDDGAAARDRLDDLDDLDGAPLASDAAIRATTAADLVDELLSWRDVGLDGFRLRPARLPDDLDRIARDVVPVLRRAGAFRDRYEADTLRGLLGLSRPANRYALAR